MADKPKYRALRGRVIVRILGSDRDKSFKHHFKKADGSSGFLYKTTDLKMSSNGDGGLRLESMVAADAARSSVFVRTGICENVGVGVDNIKEGDVCLLDFNVDNSQSAFVDWDGDDKIVSLFARTVYHKEKIVAYATQHIQKDQLVCEKDEVKSVTLIVAVIRDGEIIANDPYVILKHKPIGTVSQAESGLWIPQMAPSPDEIIEREVISSSTYSTEKYGIQNGSTVMVREADTFDIIWDGKTVTAVDDVDVLTSLN